MNKNVPLVWEVMVSPAADERFPTAVTQVPGITLAIQEFARKDPRLSTGKNLSAFSIHYPEFTPKGSSKPWVLPTVASLHHLNIDVQDAFPKSNSPRFNDWFYVMQEHDKAFTSEWRVRTPQRLHWTLIEHAQHQVEDVQSKLTRFLDTVRPPHGSFAEKLKLAINELDGYYREAWYGGEHVNRAVVHLDTALLHCHEVLLAVGEYYQILPKRTPKHPDPVQSFAA